MIRLQFEILDAALSHGTWGLGRLGPHLHDTLHLASDLRSGERALAVAQLLEPRDGLVSSTLRKLWLRVTRLHRLTCDHLSFELKPCSAQI